MISKIPPLRFDQLLADAARFWEPRRIPYNLALVAVVFIWLVATWPHFRSALTLSSFGIFTVLGLIANVCYSFAYLIDIALQSSFFPGAWRQRRWVLWLIGLIFAIVIPRSQIGPVHAPSRKYSSSALVERPGAGASAGCLRRRA